MELQETLLNINNSLETNTKDEEKKDLSPSVSTSNQQNGSPKKINGVQFILCGLHPLPNLLCLPYC